MTDKDIFVLEEKGTAKRMADRHVYGLSKEESFDAWVKSIPDCCKMCEKASWHSVVTIREQGAIMDCPVMHKCEKRMEALNVNG